MLSTISITAFKPTLHCIWQKRREGTELIDGTLVDVLDGRLERDLDEDAASSHHLGWAFSILR